MKRILVLMAAIALAITGLSVAPTMAAAGVPVLFTTNDGGILNGPYRVSYITVYVDGVKKGYTESNGNLTATPVLLPGIHKVEYVWASCNNPDSCLHYGRLTSYLMIPDQPTTFIVRIPTVRVRFVTKYGVNVSFNDLWKGVALGGGTLTTNVMAGCYTVSYKMGYSLPIPPWPTMPPYPGIPDSSLKGFYQLCFGSSDKYPVPVPVGTDMNPPHVIVNVPAYW